VNRFFIELSATLLVRVVCGSVALSPLLTAMRCVIGSAFTHVARQIASHAAENVVRHVVQWKRSHYSHVERFVERHALKNVDNVSKNVPVCFSMEPFTLGHMSTHIYARTKYRRCQTRRLCRRTCVQALSH